MIKKRETCLYCEEKMESITAKKKFCSDKCKVYWHRENAPKREKEKTKKEVQKKEEEQSLNPKWVKGDPTVGSNAFFFKFNSFSYDDENFKRN